MGRINVGQAAHLSKQMSGQPVQMNFGGSRLLQQHQPLQAASRHTGMDPLFSRMRNEMRHKM